MKVIAPVPAPDDAFFWEGLAAGRLLLQRCGDCHVVRHPPQPMCAACGSLALDAVEASGRGTVFSWIVTGDRIAAIIELDEGVRLVSNVVGVDRPITGMAVVAEIVEHDGVHLHQFRAAP